ncbi:MAG: hypothetical protein Q9195_009072 [Heterodermia aff. obscurata]
MNAASNCGGPAKSHILGGELGQVASNCVKHLPELSVIVIHHDDKVVDIIRDRVIITGTQPKGRKVITEQRWEEAAPAWLRTYKTRAAPFTSNTGRASDASTLPPMTKISEEADVNKVHSRTEPNTHDQPNTYSFAFPSTLSLGLHSFDRPEDTTPTLALHSFDRPEDTTPPQSAIHPAHRNVYSDTEDRTAASNSSSVTIKEDIRQDQNTTKDFDSEHETGWKKMIRGWIRKLACSGER